MENIKVQEKYSFFDMYDKLAFSYCLQKYLKDKEYYEINFFLDFILGIYQNISGSNKELICSENCDHIIYKEFYDKLFGDDKELYTGTMMDVLNYYYHKYIRDPGLYEIEMQNKSIEDALDVLRTLSYITTEISFDNNDPDLPSSILPDLIALCRDSKKYHYPLD